MVLPLFQPPETGAFFLCIMLVRVSTGVSTFCKKYASMPVYMCGFVSTCDSRKTLKFQRKNPQSVEIAGFLFWSECRDLNPIKKCRKPLKFQAFSLWRFNNLFQLFVEIVVYRAVHGLSFGGKSVLINGLHDVRCRPSSALLGIPLRDV